jgi:hypothetical protein
VADEETDLFGDPIKRRDGKRGRPAHRFSQEIDNKISMLLALGWSNERIANACHFSVPTLRRYYFSTLKKRDVQRDRLDAWRFEQAFRSASQGVVGGMRLLDQMIEKNDTMQAAARLRDDPEPPEPTVIGAKERARRDAAAAIEGNGSDWGDDLKPDSGLH